MQINLETICWIYSFELIMLRKQWPLMQFRPLSVFLRYSWSGTSIRRRYSPAGVENLFKDANSGDKSVFLQHNPSGDSPDKPTMVPNERNGPRVKVVQTYPPRVAWDGGKLDVTSWQSPPPLQFSTVELHAITDMNQNRSFGFPVWHSSSAELFTFNTGAKEV